MWGYTMKFGPNQLEETIAQRDGFKPVAVFDRPEQIGSVFTSVEERRKAGIGRRLLISAWASVPVKAELGEDLRDKSLHLNRVLRRLVRAKVNRFFRGQANGEDEGGA